MRPANEEIESAIVTELRYVIRHSNLLTRKEVYHRLINLLAVYAHIDERDI